MTDKPQRGKTQGDVERIAVGKRHRTPVGGVPIEEEEHTPPPQPPPTPDQMSALSPEEQLEALREAVEGNQVAIERMWGQRHAAEKLDLLVKDVTTISTTIREFVKPSVGAMMARLGAMEQSVTSNAARQGRFWDYEWPQAMKSLENLGSHMDRVEKDVDRVERTVDGLSKQVEAMNSSSNKKFDELKAMDEKQEVRLRKLEDFQLSLTTKITIIASGAGAIVAFGAFLIEHFTK